MTAPRLPEERPPVAFVAALLRFDVRFSYRDIFRNLRDPT